MVETEREPQEVEAEGDELDVDDDIEIDDELEIDDDFDSEELSEPEELDEDENEDDEELLEEEEESGSASLDELLAQRAASRRGTDDSDEDDIMSLASERDKPVGEPLITRVLPMRQEQEFVCARCRLVKLKSQLADPQRGLCRDCV